jgi:hypothetical protein
MEKYTCPQCSEYKSFDIINDVVKSRLSDVTKNHDFSNSSGSQNSTDSIEEHGSIRLIDGNFIPEKGFLNEWKKLPQRIRNEWTYMPLNSTNGDISGYVITRGLDNRAPTGVNNMITNAGLPDQIMKLVAKDNLTDDELAILTAYMG